MTAQTPVSLFDIIAYVETKNNPHAMRFEPSVYAHVVGGGAIVSNAMRNAKAFNNCSDGTANVLYCMSFGAVQIMGFNLYNGLYAGDVASFMGDPIAQAVAFDSFCASKHINYDVGTLAKSQPMRTNFAKLYNGNADAYAPLIVDALKHFGIAVTE